MNPYVRQSTLEDVFKLAPVMRQADKEEIWASHHICPFCALVYGFYTSEPCFSLMLDNEPVAMFGASKAGDYGAVWLLGSDKIRKIGKFFVQHSVIYIELMLQKYNRLANLVDARNKQSLKWLQMCGAMIDEAKPHGVEQRLFHRFQFGRG